MRLTRLLGAIVILATASTVAADIYVWRDNAGVSHYTNDLANVPAEFRGETMTVARDWARAEVPPEPQPSPAASDATSGVATADVYDAAYQAGFRAGAQTDPLPAASSTAGNVGSVVQNVQIESFPVQATERLVSVPLLVERPRVPRRAREPGDHVASRFPPASRAPFLQGPACPPPISDR